MKTLFRVAEEGPLPEGCLEGDRPSILDALYRKYSVLIKICEQSKDGNVPRLIGGVAVGRHRNLSGLIDWAANLPRVRSREVPSSIEPPALQDADEIRPAELWIKLNVKPGPASRPIDYVRSINDPECRKERPKECQGVASDLENKTRRTLGCIIR